MRRSKGFALALLLGGALLTAGAATAEAVQLPAGSGFQPLSPTRVLDTRTGSPIGQGKTITVTLPAHVPATATAVVLNVTGTQPTTPTFITVYPTGVTRPTASNLNLVAGETRPNLVTVAVGAGRKVDLYNNGGTVHLIADLAGYYAAEATSKFTAVNATRELDTRRVRDGKENNPLGQGETTTVDLSERVPASATAVAFNLTGTEATAATFVTAWPAQEPRPWASNLNLMPGVTTPNLVTVALSADKKVSLYNNAGATHLLLDLAGFYTPDFGSLFVPVTPKRVMDTRQSGGPVSGGRAITRPFDHILAFPTTGVVLNVTGTQPTHETHVTAYEEFEYKPGGSTLNLRPGQTAPNLAMIGVGHQASLSFYNNNGLVHLIADLAGYFALPPAEPCAEDCLLAWGSNESEKLGTGAYYRKSSKPAQVYGLTNVKATASIGRTSYALRSDATVWTWGDNTWGASAGLGFTGANLVAPVRIPGLSDIIAIDVGLALKADGTVWEWGPHSAVYARSPVQVPGLTDVIAIATDSAGSSFAVRSDGTVWAWGYNSFGALGIGNPDESFFTRVPVPAPDLTGVRAISGAGYGGYAIKNDGTLWSWGDNRQGQLGNGKFGGEPCYNGPPTAPNCYETKPVQVVGLTDVVSVEEGFAALANGTAWSWGNNYQGRLGTGQSCDECITATPAQITGLTGIRSVSSSFNGGYALGNDGKVWAWGANESGQLGSDTPPVSRVPVPLATPTGVSAIEGGTLAGFAIVP